MECSLLVPIRNIDEEVFSLVLLFFNTTITRDHNNHATLQRNNNATLQRNNHATLQRNNK
jgi:hypothetical protein